MLSYRTNPMSHNGEADEQDSSLHSTHGNIPESRSQLERLLMASLDHDDQRKAQHPSTSAAEPAKLPEPEHADEDGAIPVQDVPVHNDASGEPSGSTRHVYFDERMLTRQSSRQFWHHEARNARRAAFQPSSPLMDKRHAMDSLLQRLQEQIEDAGNRLRRVPSQEWSLLGSGPSEPYSERLGYEVRHTLKPQPPVPVWEERPRAVRPMALSIHLNFELHAPFFSIAAPTSAAMHMRLVGVAQEAVRHALVRREFGSHDDVAPHANLILVWLPSRLLEWMHDVLEPPTAVDQPYPAWMRPLLRSHQPVQSRLRLLEFTVPTFLLYRTNQIFVTVLELIVVFSELVLCILVASFQRIRPSAAT